MGQGTAVLDGLKKIEGTSGDMLTKEGNRRKEIGSKKRKSEESGGGIYVVQHITCLPRVWAVTNIFYNRGLQ